MEASALNDEMHCLAVLPEMQADMDRLHVCLQESFNFVSKKKKMLHQFQRLKHCWVCRVGGCA